MAWAPIRCSAHPHRLADPPWALRPRTAAPGAGHRQEAVDAFRGAVLRGDLRRCGRSAPQRSPLGLRTGTGHRGPRRSAAGEGREGLGNGTIGL